MEKLVLNDGRTLPIQLGSAAHFFLWLVDEKVPGDLTVSMDKGLMQQYAYGVPGMSVEDVEKVAKELVSLGLLEMDGSGKAIVGKDVISFVTPSLKARIIKEV